MALIKGDASNNTLTGTDLADAIHGFSGNDILHGEGGDDRLTGNFGDDTLFGGAGNDVLEGGHGRDRLIADQGDDELYGGEGHDTLITYGGRTSLIAGGGDDRMMIKGTGDFFATGETGYDTLILNLEEIASDPNSAFQNTSHRSSYFDFILKKEGIGFELHARDFEKLIVNCAGGSDVMNGSDVEDWLIGQGGHDFLRGWLGNDLLKGGRGRDHLVGDEGNDTLRGGANKDQLDGGAGDDTLHGGAGADVFIFDVAGDGTDQILDFEIGVDKIQITPDYYDFDQLSFSQETGFVEITFDDDRDATEIQVMNVTLAELDNAANFIF